jgi:hypothetical protein
MKIVDYNPKIHPKAWRGKTNFVDKNNVVVGFDDEQQCCENFGWFFATKPNYNHCADIPDKYDVEPYVFDTSFDAEGIFRLTADNLPDIYLILYNHHNGYYSHGFHMLKDGETVVGGHL